MSAPVPESFHNVEVVTKANLYFEGKVVSHTLKFEGGETKTLGVIYPGSFHFNASVSELMQIVAGQCRVRLEVEQEWKSHEPGDAFRVPAGTGFDIAVESGVVEYLCSYE